MGAFDLIDFGEGYFEFGSDCNGFLYGVWLVFDRILVIWIGFHWFGVGI